ncbi:hypothetical protein RM844_20825 [Streptomyces sp. DSM 44915]|uniref:Uncharacterized protein n=1 Tax=Streptomyces chisholmiae TaxID=3075540 RepID=A0ABU2JVF3_9ACTN|nr:hypothetical protein [Streptomyces sp. DSM 44915]MDT0268734.1 hypothetical protein [Streptomyces sp. DSM 44915]
MSLHYPFSEIDPSRFAAAGFVCAVRPRRLTARQVLEEWPLAWVPQVRMTSPRHCLHPDDRLRIEGPGLVGDVFATSGDAVLVEVESTTRAHTDPGRRAHVAKSIVELSLGSAGDFADGVGTEPLLRSVNSSLSAYARCHLAWLRALTESWEVNLALVPDPQAVWQEIATRFAASVAELDGASLFWEERAFEIEDLGVPTSATHEWVVGRSGLPLA